MQSANLSSTVVTLTDAPDNFYDAQNASFSIHNITSAAINDLEMNKIDNSSTGTPVLSHGAGNTSNAARWASMATISDRTVAVHTTTDVDGYVTAHTSVVSLMPEVVVLPDGGSPRKHIFNENTIGTAANNDRQQIPEETMLAMENLSTTSSQQSLGELCRICHGESTMESPLIAPCNCSGSMKYVHQECIQIWLKSSGSLSCELCRFSYLTGTKLEPIREWKRLELTLLERWKIVCCVMIQLFAICYFILSVEALVRAIKDFHVPQAAMWLWIKIIMSVFGITVSLACTVRQCKTFFRLFRRWQMFNRTVFVKDRAQSAEQTSATRALLGGSK